MEEDTIEPNSETSSIPTNNSDLVIAAGIGAVITAAAIYGTKGVIKLVVSIRDRRRAKNKADVVEILNREK